MLSPEENNLHLSLLGRPSTAGLNRWKADKYMATLNLTRLIMEVEGCNPDEVIPDELWKNTKDFPVSTICGDVMETRASVTAWELRVGSCGF